MFVTAIEIARQFTRPTHNIQRLYDSRESPAFDLEGKVWGMQSATNHLDLNFDVNMVVVRNGKKKTVSDSAFLHVGHCIHVDILKAFMQQNNVSFQEQ